MVNVVYPSRMAIDSSGTAEAVRAAFHTEIHAFDVDGERHFANVSDPQIPAALAPAVAGIVALHASFVMWRKATSTSLACPGRPTALRRAA